MTNIIYDTTDHWSRDYTDVEDTTIEHNNSLHIFDIACV